MSNASSAQLDIAEQLKHVLQLLGYDLTDKNFAETPLRVAKFMSEFTKPSEAEIGAMFKSFPSTYDEMVIVKDISVVSLCAHHMLPFVGKCAIGYVPEFEVIGLSKLARIAKRISRQLSLQEQVTADIAAAIMKYLDPRGCMVVIESAHQCMSLRGVNEPNSLTVTSAVRGVFAKPETGARAEFLQLVRGSK